MEILEGVVECPNGEGGFDYFDLNPISQKEARNEEVACLTPQKAPELMAAFNRAWLDCNSVYQKVLKYTNLAQKAVTDRRDELLLYTVPGKLKELGLSSTADHKTALINKDEEYRKLQAVAEDLEAFQVYLKGRMTFFMNAWNTVRKSIDGENYNYRKNSNLSGDVNRNAVAAFSQSKY